MSIGNLQGGFAARVNRLRSAQRSYASFVRREYFHIEESIQDGVSIEALHQALNEEYHLEGSLAAFKSALQRIRKTHEAKAVLKIPFDQILPSEQEYPPQYGAPQYGAPQYGAPQHGAPQHGAPQHGAPQHGAPQQAYLPQQGFSQWPIHPQQAYPPQHNPAPDWQQIRPQGMPMAPRGFTRVP